MISINASPFEKDKDKKRRKFFSKISSKYKFNLIYLNAIGGQDEIVFDGSSFMVNKEGMVIHSCKTFSEELFKINSINGNFSNESKLNYCSNIISNDNALYDAIKIGTYDYISKSNLDGVILGLSGGIDSALNFSNCQ